MKMEYSIRQNGGNVEGVAEREEIDRLQRAFLEGRTRYIFNDVDGPQAVDLTRSENVLCRPEEKETHVLGFREAKKTVPGAILFDDNDEPVVNLSPGLYFLSHPFTYTEKSGKTPEWNQADSSRLVKLLESRFPDIRIFDPINSRLGYLKAAPTEPNEEWALAQCAGILHYCNGVLFAPGWPDSSGCNKERREAVNSGIPRYFIGADV